MTIPLSSAGAIGVSLARSADPLKSPFASEGRTGTHARDCSSHKKLQAKSDSLSGREQTDGLIDKQPSHIAEEFRAARRDPRLAVLEGFHAIKHALRFGATLTRLVGTSADEVEHLAAVLAPDLRGRFATELEIVSCELFSVLAPQAPRTGTMAIAIRPQIDVARVLADPAPRPIVLLEDPRNLQNMGACVRVAAAADAGGLLTTGSQDPWHADALRGAAGLHFAIPVTRVSSWQFGDRAIVAVHPDGDRFAPKSMSARAVLAFGTERHGLSEELLSVADQRVAIPMRAGVSSLNLATSVAALLFARRLAAA